MKEIKFRAWDGTAMFYESNLLADKVNTYFMTMNGLLIKNGVQLDWPLMQYTGLKDKKRTEEFPEGQEIYEGDVVKYFEFTMYPIQKVKIPEIYVHNFDDGEFYDGSTCIVIGNIHENKDLL